MLTPGGIGGEFGKGMVIGVGVVGKGVVGTACGTEIDVDCAFSASSC
jgi:hypothetical protein